MAVSRYRRQCINSSMILAVALAWSMWQWRQRASKGTCHIASCTVRQYHCGTAIAFIKEQHVCGISKTAGTMEAVAVLVLMVAAVAAAVRQW